MKNFLMAVALGCAGLVGACNPIPAPQNLAQTTTLDEKAGIAAEVSYTAASRLGATLARAGLVDKTKFKELDNKAYAALGVVRAAYAAGNAKDYALAVATLNDVIGQIGQLAGSN